MIIEGPGWTVHFRDGRFVPSEDVAPSEHVAPCPGVDADADPEDCTCRFEESMGEAALRHANAAKDFLDKGDPESFALARSAVDGVLYYLEQMHGEGRR